LLGGHTLAQSALLVNHQALPKAAVRIVSLANTPPLLALPRARTASLANTPHPLALLHAQTVPRDSIKRMPPNRAAQAVLQVSFQH